MLPFWTLWERAEDGAECNERDFDMSLFRKARELKKEYGIIFDRENPLPTDPGLPKAVFKAGLDLFLSLGTLCSSTGRIIKINEEEVKSSLKELPKRLKLGAGRDSVTIEVDQNKRQQKRSLVAGGPCACPVSEAMYSKTMISYAKEPEVDILFCALLDTIKGNAVKTHTPSEMASAREEARLCRDALRSTGREGMCITGLVHATAEATNYADFGEGLRPTDIREIDPLNELKLDMDTLKRIYHCNENKYVVSSMMCPVLGGFAGGAEELAITCVAEALQAYTIIGGHIFQIATNHINYKTGSEQGSLWAGATALSALKLSIDSFVGDLMWIAAGPCTELQCFEIMAKSIADTVCGADLLAGAGGTGGRLTDHYTGMEARIMAEASRAASKMKMDEANAIVKDLLRLYNPQIVKGQVPQGKPFQEAYDLESIVPSKAYLRMWHGVKRKVSNLGLNFDDK